MKYLGVLFLLVFTACENGNISQNNSNSNKEGNENSTSSDEIKSSTIYGQFIYNNKGIAIDSFPIENSWIKYVISDRKQNFPYGFASHQPFLKDTLINMCDRWIEFCEESRYNEKNDSTICLKKAAAIEQFKSTEGESYFTKETLYNYYFFLSQVDSNFIYANDPQYTMIHFLKLKSLKHGLKYKEVNSKKNYVNDVNIHEIQFPEKLPVYFIESNNVYCGKANCWKEAWECGQKYDYAPVYGYLEIPPVKGIRNPKTGSEFNLEEYTMNPHFYFSFLALDETKNDLKNKKTKSYPMQLVTTKGIIRKGTGMDLNGDKKADVFWYNRIFNPHETVYQRQTQLCIKVGTEWITVYSLHYNEFYGYGTFEN